MGAGDVIGGASQRDVIPRGRPRLGLKPGYDI